MNELTHNNRVHLDCCMATKKGPAILKSLRIAARGRFEHLVLQSNSCKAVLTYDKKRITNIDALTGIIMNHPEKERLQDLFEKAIMVNNSLATEMLGVVVLAQVNILRHYYELDLKTLMEKSYPDRARPNALGSNADLFLMRDRNDEEKSNYVNALERLRNMGAMKRIYDSPIQLLDWTVTEIKSIIYAWFNGSIKKASDANIKLVFNGRSISDYTDIAAIMSEHPRSDEGRALPEDGRMFLFFEKVLNVVTSMPPGTAHERTLDLGQLTPRKLKEKGIGEKEVEDIIDGNGRYKEHNAVIMFLGLKGALRQ